MGHNKEIEGRTPFLPKIIMPNIGKPRYRMFVESDTVRNSAKILFSQNF